MKVFRKNYQALGILITVLMLCMMPTHAQVSGDWIKKTQKIKGTWSVVEKSDGAHLVLSDDFKTRKAPDLKLVLSKLSAAEANNKNALSDSIIIAPLKAVKGAQSYKLPEDYTAYRSLLIHCEQYSKLWGAADLE